MIEAKTIKTTKKRIKNKRKRLLPKLTAGKADF